MTRDCRMTWHLANIASPIVPRPYQVTLLLRAFCDQFHFSILLDVTLCSSIIVQDETLKKSQSLAFRVNSDFSTVITSLDDA